MSDFWKRVVAPVAFAGLALVATVTMVVDRRSLSEGGRDLSWWQGLALEIAVPVQKVFTAPMDSVRGVFNSYLDLVDVRSENARMRDRITQLEDENLQFREALVASKYLMQIAEMRDELEVPMLPSQVVGLDVSPWFRSVLVDRGGSHGVLPGNPVITDEGVVGLVTATSRHAAKTMLLLDRQSAIDGIVQRSRSRGVIRGRGIDELEFEFVVRGGDVLPGDIVITSGLGGVYPKGLPIGEVVSLGDPGGRLLQTATLRPAVDFGRLEHVFVMLHRGRGMELLYAPSNPAAGSADGTEAPQERAESRSRSVNRPAS